MPAPSAAQIKAFVKNALLKDGFNKKTYVQGSLVSDPTALPEDLDRLAGALSQGVADAWTAWQATQVVTIPVTAPPGSPSIGVLP